MNKKILIVYFLYNIILTLFLFSLLFINNFYIYAQNINIELYNENSYVNLNEDSVFDSGIFNLNNFDSLLLSQIKFIGSSQFFNIMINLKFRYYVNSIYNINPSYSLIIDEIYFNLILDKMYIKCGKQYHKWGSAQFFNPLDILNIKNNKIYQVMNEGSAFFEIMFPILDVISLSLFTFVKDNYIDKIDKLPLIINFKFDYNFINFFIFSLVQKNYRPIYGMNLELILPLGNLLSIKFYNESVIKFESNKTYFSEFEGVFVEKNYSKDYYLSYVFGFNICLNFEIDFIKTIDASVEFYYNDENWDNSMFKNFIDYYKTKTDLEKIQLYNKYYNIFSNSKYYIWLNINFYKIINTNTNLQMSFIYNFDDKSVLFIININFLLYSSIYLNTGFCHYSGISYSEFGSNIIRYQIYANIDLYI